MVRYSELLRVGIAVVPTGLGHIRPREANCFEFSWMIDGTVTITIEERDSFSLPPRGIFLVHPGERVEFDYQHGPSGSGLEHAFVHFDAREGAEPERWPRIRVPEVDDVLPRLLGHLVWLDVERPAGWRVALDEAFELALGLFISGESRTDWGRADDASGIIHRALALVAERWQVDGEMWTPSLSELASAAGVSSEYLGRVFTAQFGVGPISALRAVRLSRAGVLLASTDLSVREIGIRAGFVNQFHFSRAFKAHTGLAPSEFRKSGRRSIDLAARVERLHALLPERERPVR